MQRNSKLAILLVLVTVGILIWVPKGKKTKGVSAATSSVTVDHAMPVMIAAPRKRTDFVDWGRDPFVWPQREETVGSVSNLTLYAIMLSNEGACASINESIVCVGDKISGMTVKQIENNRVILTDGTMDFVLILQE